ncbi:hypothetical protein ASG84_26305 [Rhodococcus sp. Leaf278]|uniref:hypothetical protein n=1 Tax=Rhodococcus sp. Leaf278 TaxID=1736319 RepID=UPI000709DB3B|nr:hypothetical protein [Rhodococcus sp. Leaf278]KQU49266.1 hypothetical protein ASG84_26305 [Rhodococcus sp. Leaf278]
MNGEELAAIEARANAASAGPWQTFTSGVANGDHWYVWDNSTGSIAQISSNDGTNEESRQPDAEFIAHARDDIPTLLAAVRERDNAVARVRKCINDYESLGTRPWNALRAALWFVDGADS